MRRTLNPQFAVARARVRVEKPRVWQFAASSRIVFFILLLTVIFVLAGCGAGPAPLAELTVTPHPTSTTMPTETPTETASPPPTATPTPLPTSTATPSPTPLPSASLVAFETQRDGNGEIYLLHTRSGELVNLTRNPDDDRTPAWRPDGGAIAFASHRDGNWEIYVLHLKDLSITRLTHNLAYDGAPAWSPDGTQIAFESYRDGNLEIYTISIDGGQPLRLTSDPAGDFGPAWHPNGQSIAFTSWRDGNKEIYVIKATGGEAQNLTRNPADDEDPAWAPDGMALAFVSWRDVDAQTGNRNAEIYKMEVSQSTAERLTANLWPDLNPAWDPEGHLVWTAYDPGPPFETYDPYRPGDYHLFRSSAEGSERLTGADSDDRNPAPAPQRAPSLDLLTRLLPPEPPAPLPLPDPEIGAQAQIIEIPSILVGYSGQPVQVNELVAPSLVAWQQDVLKASGWDFLHETLGTWRNIDQVRKKELYAYDYGYLSWHKAGRALDLALEYKVDGANQMVLAREDLGEQIYWRMYLRTAKQDGTQGEPLKENPWLYWWHIVPEHEPEAYDSGGKRLPIPSGYYADITDLAKRYGWERIASYAIEKDYHWNTDSNGTEYWHYERTDNLIWWDAMLQIYSLETLQQYVGWDIGLHKAQSEDMMRSKGVPTPMP
jgi:TolB protein